MRTELGWMTCITADHRHPLESHSAAAPLKLAVQMSNDALKISAVLKTRDALRINAAQKISVVLRISDVQMRITTPRRQPIILQFTACHPLSYHRCNKDPRQSTPLSTRPSTSCHHLHKRLRSTQAKSNARESNSTILHHHLPLSASQNVPHERWMLMKIMMTTEKMRRREAFCLDLGLLLEMRKLALQPALTVMSMAYPKSRHPLDFDSSFVLASCSVLKCKSRFLS
jgi:hypothetical protein